MRDEATELNAFQVASATEYLPAASPEEIAAFESATGPPLGSVDSTMSVAKSVRDFSDELAATAPDCRTRLAEACLDISAYITQIVDRLAVRERPESEAAALRPRIEALSAGLTEALGPEVVKKLALRLRSTYDAGGLWEAIERTEGTRGREFELARLSEAARIFDSVGHALRTVH